MCNLLTRQQIERLSPWLRVSHSTFKAAAVEQFAQCCSSFCLFDLVIACSIIMAEAGKYRGRPPHSPASKRQRLMQRKAKPASNMPDSDTSIASSAAPEEASVLGSTSSSSSTEISNLFGQTRTRQLRRTRKKKKRSAFTDHSAFPRGYWFCIWR